MPKDQGLDYLLCLDGQIIDQGDGYWVKIEAKMSKSISKERPHGIKYCLSLHEPYGKRIMGFDNAHAIKKQKKYKGTKFYTFDHEHKYGHGRIIPYQFSSPGQLLVDFWTEVDLVLKKHKSGGKKR